MWNNVAKPTGANYTEINPTGREYYDEQDDTYDSASLFYDGIDYGAYTNVSKPTSSVWSSVAKPV